MTSGVYVWWAALCLLSVINVVAWGLSAQTFRRRLRDVPALRARWPHLLLSAGYVLGCSFRGILPRADVQRICLVDSFWSSVLVGRSVATVAELCFAAQWALLLRELARGERHALGAAVARLVVPLIVLAELCSWYAVLSTSYLGNTLEQSIWTATVALLVLSLLAACWQARGSQRLFLVGAIALCLGFVGFMCTVDVPMYLTRFLADEASGRAYLSLGAGLHDLRTRWVVTHAWSDWHEEIAWMSLYFSVAVWISIGLVHAPRAGHAPVAARSRGVAQSATA